MKMRSSPQPLPGLPVGGDANLGAGTNQDGIIALDPELSPRLYAGTPTFRPMVDVLSGTLEARLQVYGYFALLDRKQVGVGTLTGPGSGLRGSRR
jgi:hypothetical protein